MLQSLCDILNDAFREARGRSPERFLAAVEAYADAVTPGGVNLNLNLPRIR